MTKKIDTSTIAIERIIVHDVPKHKKDDLKIEPNYSEQESKITDGLRSFFRDKVIQALNSDKCFKICFDDSSDSPMSYIVAEMLGTDGNEVVKQSKSITKHLFEKQIGINTAGILVVIFGKVNSHNAVIVLKLERDTGAQLTMDNETHSYNIEEVRDLMLTQKTKIFKVAMFILRSDFNSKYDGLIMDYQIDMKLKKEVTNWFMDKFLGCKAFEDPKITTQHFFHHTRAYINTLEDPLDRVKYTQDLNSYVQKNTQTLNPKEFADDYLKVEHRDNYKKFLESKKFKFTSFPKDLSSIDRIIKKITLQFANDISIIGNKGTFDKEVKLKKMKNGNTKAEIVSKITKIS